MGDHSSVARGLAAARKSFVARRRILKTPNILGDG